MIGPWEGETTSRVTIVEGEDTTRVTVEAEIEEIRVEIIEPTDRDIVLNVGTKHHLVPIEIINRPATMEIAHDAMPEPYSKKGTVQNLWEGKAGSF